jgi:hypothetical protein
MNAKSINQISGDFTIDVDNQSEPILSPDKTLKLIPCDHCYKLEWKNLNVVSFLCDDCSYKAKIGELVDNDIP